jgi:hypothetical protein
MRRPARNNRLPTPVLLVGAVALSLALLAPSVDAEPRAGVTRVPAFKHVIVVVFENHSARRILDYPGSPFRRLGHRYALLTRYDAVAHPSLPNYLALVSGSTYGLRHDCTACLVRGRSLADTLAARGLTWRMYVEQFDHYRDQGRRITGPERARLPFLFFRDLVRSRRARRSEVALTAFYRDLRAGRLPSFSLVVPDLCHDMHSCSIAAGNRWMTEFLHVLRPGALKGTAVFVVFDEGPRHDRRGGGGRVPAIVAGPLVRAHSVSAVRLTHYSLLRTIEDAWRLPALGHSATAAPITGIWRGK